MIKTSVNTGVMSSGKVGVKRGVFICKNIYNRYSDLNAKQFMYASGISNNQIKDAIYRLCIDLKMAGIFAKCTAIFPFVGGTATAHVVNLINPTLNGTFLGGMGHSANGIQGNGTNAYMNTGVLGSALPQDNNHLSLYIRTNAQDTNAYDIGTAVSGTRVLGFRSRKGDDNIDAYNNNLVIMNGLNTISQRLQLYQRTASNASAYYRDNILINSSSAASNGTSAFNIFICTTNVSGTPQASYTTRQYAYASMGQSFTMQERTDYNTIINNFQTQLGRNV